MAKKQTKNNKKELIIEIGWREWISFPKYNDFSLKAKIDQSDPFFLSLELNYEPNQILYSKHILQIILNYNLI